jgi:hypothetical protein
MGFFRKKEEPPRIQRSSTLPELPRESRNQVSELPTMPQSTSNDNLNESMIKSAMDDNYSSEEDEVKPDEILHEHPMEHRQNHLRLPSSFSRPSRMERVSARPKRETIFVKIDEFNRAQDSLAVIDETLKELSSDIQTLKEIKLKEVDELNSWDEELKKINARLSKMDSTIFGEV